MISLLSLSGCRGRAGRFIAPCTLLLLAGCGSGGTEQAAAPPAPPPPQVTVAAAIERDVVESDEFAGRLAAIETVEIRARVSGYLDAIHFTPGAEVERGALLFTIDPRPFEARLAEAEAQKANTQADLELARSVLARQEQMLGDRATSRREFDAAAAAVARLAAVERANDATIASARLELAYTRITAPVAGRVGKEEITVGNLVQGDAPDSPVLTTLVSVDPIWVSFEADESAYLRYIRATRGSELAVDVGLADEAGFPHRATLAYVDNQVDPATGTLRLRAHLDNAERKFTPGLFARVRVAAATAARRAVMVADRAIGTDQSKRYVLVVGADNVAAYREVKIGRQYDGLRIIESGLAAGEEIVVNGLQRVRPGTPVTPEKVDMATVVGAAAREAGPG